MHGERYRIGDLLLHVGTQQVTRENVEIPLTRLSFNLLLALARAAPEILTIDELDPGVVCQHNPLERLCTFLLNRGDRIIDPFLHGCLAVIWKYRRRPNTHQLGDALTGALDNTPRLGSLDGDSDFRCREIYRSCLRRCFGQSLRKSALDA